MKTPRAGSFLKALSLAAFGVAASLVIVEFAFRLLDRFTTLTPTWSDRPAAYFKAENSETLQDYPHSPTKPPGTFRIAVIGDSFSFAPYMQFTDAFPKKLEQMLNLNSTSLKAEVINYGVPGFSTMHEIETIKRATREQADLIILQVTLNDPEIKVQTPTGITKFEGFAAVEYGPFAQWLLRHWHSLNFILQRIHNANSRRAYTEYFLKLFEDPTSMRMFERSLSQISGWARGTKTQMVAVVFPLFGFTLDKNYPLQPLHDKAAALLTKQQILFKDISESYTGIPAERLQVLPGLDAHPNEIAHRIAAEAIYTWLVSIDKIPQELRIKSWLPNRVSLDGLVEGYKRPTSMPIH